MPAECQREALPRSKSLVFTKPGGQPRIKSFKPRSSASSGSFYVPIFSTPIPAVYKLMNSLLATHLKNLILSAQRGQNNIICDVFFGRDSDGKEI